MIEKIKDYADIEAHRIDLVYAEVVRLLAIEADAKLSADDIAHLVQIYEEQGLMEIVIQDNKHLYEKAIENVALDLNVVD